MAGLAAIVVAVVSCGHKGNNSTSQFMTGSGGKSSAASTGTNAGGGGSSATLMITTSSGSGGDAGGDAPMGATCPAAVTCAMKGYDCGPAADGCGGILQCGVSCPAGQLCGVDPSKPNNCGKPPCTPVTCMALGVTCGMEGDGCGGTINCGTCTLPDTCGGGGMNGQCGHLGGADAAVCMPAACPSGPGITACGPMNDGCGNLLQCGATCPGNTTCGGGGTNNVCGAPPCMPTNCGTLGANCGMQADGCGGLLDCGTCGAGQTCGGGGMANQCGAPMCTGLCMQQVMCTTGTTSISGTVYAPNGVDPLPDVTVYVPNGTPQPFTPGVSCSCASQMQLGYPLVTTTTAFDGTFTLNNMPVGSNIPIVIQNGRWRRQMVIPMVPACVNTPLPNMGANQLRFPRTKAEGDIPSMGFVTGSVDALECVLRKIGIDDTEFSDPGGTGRVQFYLGAAPPNGAAGATYSNATPHENMLWGSQATINQYDMVYFACQGKQYNKTAAAQQTVINYANAGGRVFATHFSYVWLFNDAPFSNTANWQVSQGQPTPDPQTGYINQAFPRGATLAQWLQVVGGSTTLGQIQINTLRHDFNNVVAPSLLWISLGGTPIPPGTVPMHYTFDTPVGNPPAQQCGRVLFDDFHVENAMTGGTMFPNECTVSGMTPQEKMLEFMIFDLGASLCPPPAVCTPMPCPTNVTCGMYSNGCGGTQACGTCAPNQVCQGGSCQTPMCPAQTCVQQGYMCGETGDGCGNTLMCGMCPSGQTCGGGGPGKCGINGCVPNPCPPTLQCGPAGDGCGNLIQCGMCPAGETCGGGNVAGMCGKPMCTPKTCMDLGFNCGDVNDTCGNIINCGMCTAAGQTCGGSGMANMCGMPAPQQ
jgi:hypothetical protein